MSGEGRAVASAIGISKATISRIERGKSIPSLKVLSALNKFFGINISYDGVVKEPDKPDAIKGWIEIHSSSFDEPMFVRVDEVFSVCNNRVKIPKLESWGVSSVIDTTESYEELKQKIKEAQ